MCKLPLITEHRCRKLVMTRKQYMLNAINEDYILVVNLRSLTTYVISKLFQRKTFIRDTKVFPLVNQTGWKPNPHTFRKVVGTTEVVAGSVLAIVPGKLGSLQQRQLNLV